MNFVQTIDPLIRFNGAATVSLNSTRYAPVARSTSFLSESVKGSSVVLEVSLCMLSKSIVPGEANWRTRRSVRSMPQGCVWRWGERMLRRMFLVIIERPGIIMRSRLMAIRGGKLGRTASRLSRRQYRIRIAIVALRFRNFTYLNASTELTTVRNSLLHFIRNRNIIL